MTPMGSREPSAAEVALKGACPQCGARTLFAGWVQFAPVCRSCGLDFAAFNVGDGAAAILILVVGAIVVVGAMILDAEAEPPLWVHVVWIPVAAALTLGGLRLTKAWLLAQEYRHQAGEGREVK